MTADDVEAMNKDSEWLKMKIQALLEEASAKDVDMLVIYDNFAYVSEFFHQLVKLRIPDDHPEVIAAFNEHKKARDAIAREAASERFNEVNEVVVKVKEMMANHDGKIRAG
jgi:hypothetical protein